MKQPLNAIIQPVCKRLEKLFDLFVWIFKISKRYWETLHRFKCWFQLNFEYKSIENMAESTRQIPSNSFYSFNCTTSFLFIFWKKNTNHLHNDDKKVNKVNFEKRFYSLREKIVLFKFVILSVSVNWYLGFKSSFTISKFMKKFFSIKI